MKVYLEQRRETMEISDCNSGTALLLKLKMNVEEVILTKNGEVILPHEPLCDSDEVHVLAVVSGG